ncbi:MAG: hypothetical protein L3K00_02490 [Thermoplasmata archaeon]|nr:hypothetical protein [Thermoplasmata archaeon]
MSGPSPYYRPPGMGDSPRPGRSLWLVVVVAVVFVGFALVLLAYLVDPALFGVTPSSTPYRYGVFGLFPVFFVLLVGFFIVRVVFWSTRAGRRGGRYGGNDGYGPDRPARMARMRYARGEITREQYNQIMQDLGRGPGPP